MAPADNCYHENTKVLMTPAVFKPMDTIYLGPAKVNAKNRRPEKRISIDIIILKS